MKQTTLRVLTGLLVALSSRGLAGPSASAPACTGERKLATLMKSNSPGTFCVLTAEGADRRDVSAPTQTDTHDVEIQPAAPAAAATASPPGTVRRSIAKADASRTRGTKSVLFVRVNFPDALEEPISVRAAEALMEGTDEFFRRNSYGALALTATVTPVLTLPQPTSWYAAWAGQRDDFLPLLQDARAIAEAAGYPTVAYDLDCIFTAWMPKYLGLGYFGKGVLLRINHVGAAAHEFGHNLGLYHAEGWQATASDQLGTGKVIEYRNPFDTMGDGWAQEWDFNAFEKHVLGWLPDNAVQLVSSNGVFHLEPSDTTEPADGATYALRFKKDGMRDYWVETRRRLKDASAHSVLVYHTGSQGANFTRLLDATPETSRFDDAPFLAGQVFFDSELGLKLMAWPTADSGRPTVAVLVQTLQQVVIEAEAGELPAVLRVDAEAEASQGRLLTSGQTSPATARYQVEIPVAGHYALWARVATPAGPGGVVNVFVDGERLGALSVSTTEGSGTWGWVRAQAARADSTPLLAPVPLFLTAGEHQLSLGFYGAMLQLDCLVLSTDPTQNSLPVISPLSPQTVVSGQSLGPLLFNVLDLESAPSALTVSAKVGNTNVLPTANLELVGAGFNRALVLTASANRFGTTTVSLTVTDSHRNVRSTSFKVTILGALQSLIDTARAGDTLVLPAGRYCDNVTLAKDLTIEAEPGGATVIDGQRLGVPFTVASNATVSLRGLVIRNGRGSGVVNFGALRLSDCIITENLEKPGAGGGGILNQRGGSLQMERCRVTRNTAYHGAGVHNLGHLWLSECTISENTAFNSGGGLLNRSAATASLHRSTLHSNRVKIGDGGGLFNTGDLTAWNVTISGNSAEFKDGEDGEGGLGGGVFNSGTALFDSCTIADNQATVAAGGILNKTTLALRNTIVARNALADGTPNDGAGRVASLGFNLVQTPDQFLWEGVATGNLLGFEPLLTPLTDYGGPTPIHLPIEGSPVIDTGSSDGLCVDQRGAPRPPDEPTAPHTRGQADIGAVEFPASTAISSPTASEQDAPAGMTHSTGDAADGCEVDRTLARLYPKPAPPGAPFQLLLATRTPSGTFLLEASTNLTDWVPIATVAVSGYLGWYEDPEAMNFPIRFYRARLQTP